MTRRRAREMRRERDPFDRRRRVAARARSQRRIDSDPVRIRTTTREAWA